MNDFNVLFTCCSLNAEERINLVRHNEDLLNVKVYAVNNNPKVLPPADKVDGSFVVPAIYDKDYLPTLLEICKKYDVSVIVPTVTLELDFMAKNRGYFESRGLKVSIASSECLAVANNKIELQKRYFSLMPKQCLPTKWDDVEKFLVQVGGNTICCKLSDHCGGNGFAIVNDEKAHDITLFNKYAENRYISFSDLKILLERHEHDIILQEFLEGYDYTVSVLAVNGNVTHICGYAGYAMVCGSIIHGEILYNAHAYSIAEKLTKELNIDGNACFDFRIKTNGDVVLLEINPRVNASLGFVRQAGCNMLFLRCKNLFGDFTDNLKTDRIRYGLKMRKYLNPIYYYEKSNI